MHILPRPSQFEVGDYVSCDGYHYMVTKVPPTASWPPPPKVKKVQIVPLSGAPVGPLGTEHWYRQNLFRWHRSIRNLVVFN
jgi:hypothetical protein